MTHLLPPLIAALTLAIACDVGPGHPEADRPSDTGVRVDPVSADASPASREADPTAPTHLARAGKLRLTGLGLAQPAGVVHDPLADVYLVSNLNRVSGPLRPHGFISSVLPDGTLEALRWIDGEDPKRRLRAPTGLALIAGRLYVADVDRVVVFDRESGRLRRTIPIPGASNLTHMAAGEDGQVYVTDGGAYDSQTAAQRPSLFVISKRGTVRPVLKSSVFGAVRGVATLGPNVWMTLDDPKALMGLDPSGRLQTSPLTDTDAISLLAGVDATRMLIARSDTMQVLIGSPSGPFAVVVSDLEPVSALGWDSFRERVLMTEAQTNTLVIQNLATSGLRSTSPAPSAD